jgi:hypothetical protein
VRRITIPTLADLELDEPNREKQATSLRCDAYQFARYVGRNIRIKLRDGTEKGLRDLFWSWGVATDKVLGGAESTGLTLSVPLQLVDKLVIAVQSKASVPQAIDNTAKDRE